jgi:anti-sigma factor ChrR (cupin superfamily)
MTYTSPLFAVSCGMTPDPTHSHHIPRSADGMHEGLCPGCEALMDECAAIDAYLDRFTMPGNVIDLDVAMLDEALSAAARVRATADRDRAPSLEPF